MPLSNTSVNAPWISGIISWVRVALPCFSNARLEMVRVRMAAPTDDSRGRREEASGVLPVTCGRRLLWYVKREIGRCQWWTPYGHESEGRDSRIDSLFVILRPSQHARYYPGQNIALTTASFETTASNDLLSTSEIIVECNPKQGRTSAVSRSPVVVVECENDTISVSPFWRTVTPPSAFERVVAACVLDVCEFGDGRL
jgi:hypothetical protein